MIKTVPIECEDDGFALECRCVVVKRPETDEVHWVVEEGRARIDFGDEGPVDFLYGNVATPDNPAIGRPKADAADGIHTYRVWYRCGDENTDRESPVMVMIIE